MNFFFYSLPLSLGPSVSHPQPPLLPCPSLRPPTDCVSPGLPDWSWGFLLLRSSSSVCMCVFMCVCYLGCSAMGTALPAGETSQLQDAVSCFLNPHRHTCAFDSYCPSLSVNENRPTANNGTREKREGNSSIISFSLSPGELSLSVCLGNSVCIHQRIVLW